MTNKKIGSMSKLLSSATLLVFSLFKFIPNVILLVEIEARSVAKSITALLILYLIAGSLVTTSWLCILAMIFLFLISLQLSWILSLLIIVIINILILIIIGLLISNSLGNLSFQQTRELIRNIKQ